MVPGIGNVNAKKLIAYCQGAEAVFHEKKERLLKIPGIGNKVVAQLHSNEFIDLAEQEIEFMQRNQIQGCYYLEDQYPYRLKHCEDGPIILYTKGNFSLNPSKCVSVVGTRKATVKGRETCEKLIEELSVYQPTIISGLAYGIDIVAHKTSIRNHLETIAVMASGLDQIYPRLHEKTALAMQQKGGIISDYRSNSTILPVHFAERNRIVAGMADIVVVIESSLKGGSLITADLANGYHRDVAAFPGRPSDSQSEGCNMLIKQNKAALVESAKDIAELMGWEALNTSPKQTDLFVELSDEEQLLVDHIKINNKMGLDELSLAVKMPISRTTALLLSLEFKGVVKSLPGKIFQLSRF